MSIAHPDALVAVMPEVFPWIEYLEEAEVRAFTVELIEALSDTAELEADSAVQEVIAGWRATARIKADPQEYRDALASTEGDYGPVEVVG